MNNSPLYPAIKKYYDAGHPKYTDETLKGFVQVGMITADEYKKITGIDYVNAA